MDKYADLRALLSQKCNAVLIDDPDMLRALLADADRAADLEQENARLRAALQEALATIQDYLDYDHDGDPWSEDARIMGEMDINDYATDGRMERARAALAQGERHETV